MSRRERRHTAAGVVLLSALWCLVGFLLGASVITSVVAVAAVMVAAFGLTLLGVWLVLTDGGIDR